MKTDIVKAEISKGREKEKRRDESLVSEDVKNVGVEEESDGGVGINLKPMERDEEKEERHEEDGEER